MKVNIAITKPLMSGPGVTISIMDITPDEYDKVIEASTSAAEVLVKALHCYSKERTDEEVRADRD